MPRFDKTGPEGKGPMTGRGLGPCNPNITNPQTYQGPFGIGAGAGFGLGRGFRQGFGRRLGGRRSQR